MLIWVKDQQTALPLFLICLYAFISLLTETFHHDIQFLHLLLMIPTDMSVFLLSRSIEKR